MAVSFYDFAMPSICRPLRAMLTLLDKAEADFATQGRDITSLTALRLASDMNPFPLQIEAAINNAVGAAARLRGQAAPRVEGFSALADMRRALTAALATLDALEPYEFEGAETREIVLPSPKGARHFEGLDYLVQLALPNVQFHTSIAYALLRAEGVGLGKRDFLGELPPRRPAA